MPIATDTAQTINQKPSCADNGRNIALQSVKELEDLPGFPPLLRQMQTEYIGWMVRFFRVYRRLPGLITQRIPARLMRNWQDIGSGSGGPISTLAQSPEWKSVSFTLSDLFPQQAHKLPPNCRYESRPVDALKLQTEPAITVSFFNAFHHFSLDDQCRIIEDQLRAGNALVVAEILQPNPLSFLRILLATTIGQILFCPFVAPFRWKRILFTWMIPVNIITVTWDGLVSVLKSPKHSDYSAWTQQTALSGGESSVLAAGDALLPVTLFIAWPKNQT
jgi:hypothetical protein